LRKSIPAMMHMPIKMKFAIECGKDNEKEKRG